MHVLRPVARAPPIITPAPRVEKVVYQSASEMRPVTVVLRTAGGIAPPLAYALTRTPPSQLDIWARRAEGGRGARESMGRNLSIGCTACERGDSE